MTLRFRDLSVAVVILAAIGAAIIPGLVFIQALTGIELPFQLATVGRLGAGVVGCVGSIAYARRRAYKRHARQRVPSGERD